MNIKKIRKDTLGASRQIFMNSAGSSLPPKIVVKKMIEYLREEEQLGGYKTAVLESEVINDFYIEAAKLINCQPKNIAFACSATEGYAKALSSIPFAAGDYILTTDDDYISNQIAFISLEKRFGIKLIRSANLENGDMDLQNFEQLMVNHKPKLVAITHIPTNSGLVQQAAAVGQLCKKYDTLYLLDACQSLGQMVVDVQQIGCDFLSTTGRKFLRGPRGTGFLYVSDKVLNLGLAPLFLDFVGANWNSFNDYSLLPDAKRFSTWELSYASLIGFIEALRYINNLGIENIYQYNKQLTAQFREMLAGVKGLSVLDKGSELSAIITIRKAGKTLPEMEAALKKHRIIYSIASKQSALIDFTKKEVDWAIRLSPHYFNTVKELETVIEVLDGM